MCSGTLLRYMLLEGGHMNIIQYLITELGCDPEYSKHQWQSPTTQLLCSNGHLDTTKYFVTEQNCDPNIRDQHESTPLHPC